MLCTFLKSDSGNVIVNGNNIGFDDDKIRNDLGIVFQDGLLDSLLSVKDNLKIRGSLYGLRGDKLDCAVNDVASMTCIKQYLNRPYGKLSGGQKRRCDIARALIHKPMILFLDECTTGLDPYTRKHIWKTIKSIQKINQMTVFLATHYMEEAVDTDYIVVIDDGVIIAKGTPIIIKQTYSNDKLYLISNDNIKLIETLNKNNIDYKLNGENIQILLNSTLDSLEILGLVKKIIQVLKLLKQVWMIVLLILLQRS